MLEQGTTIDDTIRSGADRLGLGAVAISAAARDGDRGHDRSRLCRR
jgi:hypothetical protein